MTNKRLFWLFSLVLSLSTLLVACSANKDNESGTGDATNKEEHATKDIDTEQVLNLIETAEIPSMDSALAEDSVAFLVLNNVNEGLYRLSQDNIAEPAIAESEPEVSEDGLTYTFKLREDAKWSNGAPVTSHDFVFAWQRAIDPNTGSPYGPYMMSGTIANATSISKGEMKPSELGVKAPDDKTLVVTLERPIPYFLSLMAFGTFYPQNENFITEKGDSYASNSENLLYNGPFILKEWDGTSLSWIYNKNPEYWDAEKVHLDTINVDVVKETSTAVNLYQSGEKDLAELSGEFAMQYADDPEVVENLNSSLYYLNFNQERNGEKTPLANVNIRKAIAQGFNKEDLANEILANGSIPANGLVPANYTFNKAGEDFRDINGDLLTYNPKAAKEAWAKGMEELGINELSLELLGGDSEISKKMDEYIKAQLEENLEGLTIEIRELPFSVRLELDKTGDYDIQNSGWGPDYQDPMTFIDLFITSPRNTTAYSNSEYDKLVEQAKSQLAKDPEARWKAMAEAERILLEEDAAIAPIYQQGERTLQQEYVYGIVKHSIGGDYSYKWAYISGKE